MNKTPSPTIQAIKELIEKERSIWLKDFFTFLSYPSISAQHEYKSQLLECAHWLENYLQSLNFDVELWPTSGHPVVFASHCYAGADKPTLLIYNHYDVQPVGSLTQWHHPPFTPALCGNNVFARGAQDNKGQCFYVLQALKFFLKHQGSFPINIKLCIEGEEETGSQGLSEILEQKREKLKADYIAIADLGIHDDRMPSITLGVRGIVTMDVEVKGSHIDLHSGYHGGIARNPIHVLVELLGQLRNGNGKICIPGFYDKVVQISAQERMQLALHFDAVEYQRVTGAYPTGGERDLPILERVWFRPTLEVNGIWGGYIEEGFKTIIPAKAHAKISCRLVENQDPVEISHLVADYLKTNAPPGMEVTVKIHPGMGKPFKTKASSKIVHVFAQAFQEAFDGIPCEYILEGASIPITWQLAETCRGDVVLLGLGLPTDQIHAPNEHFSLDRLEKGILIIARAIELLGA